jgi:hypothetical protein
MTDFSSGQVGFNRYLFEYRHEGSDWGIEIVAKSPDDARARLNALNWARYQGQVAAKIPVPGASLIERIIAHLRLR